MPDFGKQLFVGEIYLLIQNCKARPGLQGAWCAVAISTGQMAACFYFSTLISRKFNACQTLLGVMILFIIEFIGKAMPPQRCTAVMSRLVCGRHH